MMNRRTWIAGITATTLLAASLAACKQEQQGEETGQALPVMVVSSQPIELEETYSASIRGRQDVEHHTSSIGSHHPPVRERGRASSDRASAGCH